VPGEAGMLRVEVEVLRRILSLSRFFLVGVVVVVELRGNIFCTFVVGELFVLELLHTKQRVNKNPQTLVITKLACRESETNQILTRRCYIIINHKLLCKLGKKWNPKQKKHKSGHEIAKYDINTKDESKRNRVRQVHKHKNKS